MERKAYEDECRELNVLASRLVEMELQQRLLHEELSASLLNIIISFNISILTVARQI